MKQTILLILMSIFYVNAQVEDCTILSKYAETYNLHYSSGDYESNEDGEWFDVYLTFRDDYIIVEAADMELKIFWNHLSEFSDENSDCYETEDGDIACFFYDTQELFVYTDYNENIGEYDLLEVYSKTSVVE